jgi:hypothetical protein
MRRGGRRAHSIGLAAPARRAAGAPCPAPAPPWAARDARPCAPPCAGIGALLGLVLVALILLYPAPKKARSSPAVSDSEVASSSQQGPAQDGDLEARLAPPDCDGSPRP